MDDREEFLRVMLGAIILLAGLCFRNILGVIGLVPVATGLVRWCPARAMLLRVATVRVHGAGRRLK